MIIYDKYEKRGAVHWDFYSKDNNYKVWVDWLSSLFPSSGSVLDIGCGDGLWSMKLSRNGLDVVGFDISDHGIKIAKDKQMITDSMKNIKFFVSECEFLADNQVKDFEFDYALATEIIEHTFDWFCIKKIFEKYIKKSMILTTVDRINSKHHSILHTKEFSEEEIKGMFKEYKIERIRNEKLSGEFNTNECMVFKINKI